MSDELENQKVETLTGDMLRVMKAGRDGAVKKIIEEQEKREMEAENLSPASGKNKFFIIGSIVLLLLAVGAVGFIFFSEKSGVMQVKEQFRPLIFSEATAFIDVSGASKDEIETAIYKRAQNTKIKPSEIEGLYLALDKQTMGFSGFSKLIGASIAVPDDTLIDENFLLGVFKDAKGEKEIFILLKTRSFGEIFPVMRAWEKKMFFDLHGFFGNEITKETTPLVTRDFESGIVRNKNARILYEGEKPVLMYVFLDNHYVLITDSDEATREVIHRLTSSKISK